jgi:hypothetical protein
MRIHRSFEQHEFWALMFPGMLPPPMPFKIFVLGAAVFEMRFRDFLAAILREGSCASRACSADAMVRAADCGTDGDGLPPTYLLGAGGDCPRSFDRAAGAAALAKAQKIRPQRLRPICSAKLRHGENDGVIR